MHGKISSPRAKRQPNPDEQELLLREAIDILKVIQYMMNKDMDIAWRKEQINKYLAWANQFDV